MLKSTPPQSRVSGGDADGEALSFLDRAGYREFDHARVSIWETQNACVLEPYVLHFWEGVHEGRGEGPERTGK